MTLKLVRITNHFFPLLSFKTPILRNYEIGILKNYSTSAAEKNLIEILQRNFPNAKNVMVEDISGGCGAMYNVYVESNDLKGLSIIKQHQAVTNALKEQIKTFHGIRIETKVPAN